MYMIPVQGNVFITNDNLFNSNSEVPEAVGAEAERLKTPYAAEAMCGINWLESRVRLFGNDPTHILVRGNIGDRIDNVKFRTLPACKIAANEGWCIGFIVIPPGAIHIPQAFFRF